MIHVAARTAVGGQVHVAIKVQPLAGALGRGAAEERLTSVRQCQTVDEELGRGRGAFRVDVGDMAGVRHRGADQTRELDVGVGFGIDLLRSRLDADHLGLDDRRFHGAIVIPLGGDDLPLLARSAFDIERLRLLRPGDEGLVRHAIGAGFDLLRVDQGERLAGEWPPTLRQ